MTAFHEGLFESARPTPAAPPRVLKSAVVQRKTFIVPPIDEKAPVAPVPAHIVAAVHAARWPGILLPKLSIGGSLVYPVIAPNLPAWHQRVAARQHPELDPSTIVLWESWTEDLGPMPPATALSIVGFVSDARAHLARRAVNALRGLGAGMVVHTGVRRPTQESRWECDYQGLFLVWASAKPPAALCVPGRLGPVSTARRIALTRVYEEKLFSWALHSRYGPASPTNR